MASTEHGETFTVRRVDERSWADLVTLTLENGELIMLTVEQYDDGKAAIAKATGVPLAAVDMQGMTLTFSAGGISVPSSDGRAAEVPSDAERSD